MAGFCHYDQQRLGQEETGHGQGQAGQWNVVLDNLIVSNKITTQATKARNYAMSQKVRGKPPSVSFFQLTYSSQCNNPAGCSFPRGRGDIVRRKYRYLTGNIHKSLHIDENL